MSTTPMPTTNAIDQLESLYSRLIDLNVTLGNRLVDVIHAAEAPVDSGPVNDSSRILELLDRAHREVSDAESLLCRVVL